MGAVYEVEDTVLSRRRALKTLLPELGSDGETRRRFQVEIDALKLIQHDAIVDIVDVGYDPELGFPFLVMDYLEGKNLEELLKAHRALDAGTSLKILSQVASGLDAIHAARVVHRDLKPSNIFIERRASGLAEVRLLDFGVAKILDTGANHTTLIAGTPGYMSPEQLQGHVDPLTDIYALGKLARVMLCGLGSLAEFGPNAAGLPASFDQWFAAATALNKDERFARASLAVEALAAALGVSKHGASYIEWAELVTAEKAAFRSLERGATEPAPSLSPSSGSLGSMSVSSSGVRGRPSRPRRRRTVWALGVAVALMLVTCSGWWLGQQRAASFAAAQREAPGSELPKPERAAPATAPSREPPSGSAGGAALLETAPGSAGVPATGGAPVSESATPARGIEHTAPGAPPSPKSGKAASTPTSAPEPRKKPPPRGRSRTTEPKDARLSPMPKASSPKKPSDDW